MKIKIVLEVDADDIDWQKSSVMPCDTGMVDVDIDQCIYDGQPIEFLDDDAAANYLINLYHDADHKDYRYA